MLSHVHSDARSQVTILKIQNWKMVYLCLEHNFIKYPKPNTGHNWSMGEIRYLFSLVKIYFNLTY